MAGYFITLEGIEGCGKSTQCQRLAASLQEAGRAVLTSREPGGTRLGAKIRDVLLHTRHGGMGPRAELLLYEADRAQHVEEILRPALEAGKIVLCDRFTDSTLAYQGYGRGLDLDVVRQLNAAAALGLKPDLTILLDLPADVGMSRIRDRAERLGSERDRIEQEDIPFHDRVRQGFLALAAGEPERIVVVNAEESFDEVSASIRLVVMERLATMAPKSPGLKP